MFAGRAERGIWTGGGVTVSVVLSGRECLGKGRKGCMDWGWGYSVSDVVRQGASREGQKGVYGLGVGLQCK